MTSARSATIEVEQLPSGYWRGSLTVRLPDVAPLTFSNDLFHNAGEALDWARLTLETVIAHA